MSVRSAAYNMDEDILLCRVYIEISEDPVVGINQTSDRLWSRIEEAFNGERLEHWEIRTKRSMQARLDTIQKAARRLNACIKQIENMHQSGASNEDIMFKAKVLFTKDSKFKAGWKFDHVWNIVKNFQKFKDCSTSSRRNQFVNYVSSESENPTPDSVGQASPGISSFSLNLEDSNTGSPSERPIGVKKAKLKRKNDVNTSLTINEMQETNKKIAEEMKRANDHMQTQLDMQKKRYELKKSKEDNKTLRQDLSKIEDPNVRAFIRAQQAQIMKEKAQNESQPDPSTPATFSDYFNNLGGSGANLPYY
ncbi:uncharacterized protein LOC124917316 [Impatiens glandulifera]|uniref:uncharacterized protein LOC124917316 n=1 Tax=Impatiens glandulifera TaxID=253017 RepID=UPI001FB0E58C|nr:uncharacterized protein LOC124917316 [Impatiens glandulifera]